MVPGLPAGTEETELAELLEIGAHGVTAILATWLGLLVLTRARRAPGAPVFAFLCLLLTIWSVAIIVQRIGSDPSVKPAVNLAEDLSAFLLPAATLHIALLIAIEGRRSATANALLVGGYALAVAAGAQAVLDPGHPISFTAPYFAPFGLPDTAMAWAFALARASLFAAGIVYLGRALLLAGSDVARRQQLRFALATVVLGVIGGMARILPEEIGGPRWVGVSVVATAVVMATYAVLAQHVFVAADVAGRAVRGSVVAGLGVVAYVALLIGVERTVGSMLAIDFPLVTTLAIIVTLVLFDPISDRIQNLLAGSPRAAAEERLQQALGADPMLAQAPDRAVEPALARLVRTFGLAGAEVADGNGAIRARVGAVDPEDPLAVRLELATAGTGGGVATFGRKLNGLSFTAADLDALGLAASYLGSSLRLAERQHQQASALADLREERAAVQSRGSALTEALAEASVPPAGLRIHALGSLRAELDGAALHRWGGEKAGARQAEAIFAFLFDRGDRGATKDEIIELVWPDVDLDRADVAFHRTMLGLRSALKPGLRARAPEGPIGFRKDRYRLEPSVVAWSDVGEFEALLAQAGAAEPDAAVGLLERARALYRGDYLDDCPYYGDSAQVEERRTDLRRRFVDVLTELGERYAERGDRTAAASLLRQAQAVADDELPRVTEALGRLATARPGDSG
jgi:DNA-binding SARP family transcriptional activator